MTRKEIIPNIKSVTTNLLRGLEWELPVMRTGLLTNFCDEEIHNTLTDRASWSRKTYNKVATTYYWPKMSRDIKRYVSTCDICQKAKPRRHAPAGYCNLFLSFSAFEVVSMDLFQNYLCLMVSTIFWLLLIS